VSRDTKDDGCASQSRSRSCQEKSAPPTLVWIDDYEPGLALYKKVYEALGYRIHTASRGQAGLALLASRSADAVVVDYEMPEMNGGEVAASIKQQWPSLPVVLFSGSTFIPERVKKLVDALCDKASSREHLHSTIQNLLKKKEQTQNAISFMTARRGRLAVA
jgi:CheY-like chemotaxis protein